ncbi:hypothetical protein [Rhizobium straminoryzae]|uniref:Uncharacterized protein n=1 Tax=Rhizobium straminoryzae TaxID=1387186 RepID=A0A549TD05_9HYPH|nr:hypothetical protein [Rhizobium straminoryzae]TRL39844.1 hypothetical protein FNA46_07875 [Rhizobium straminoryzae]
MTGAKMREAARIALKGIRAAVEASAIRHADRRAAELYLLVTGCNVPQVLAAEVAACTKQNVSKLLAAAEERRDNPDFDAALSRIERAILGE